MQRRVRGGGGKRKSGIRRRDILLFVGCFVGIILSFQNDGSVAFSEGVIVRWAEDLPDDDLSGDARPKPIVTDLDGDGTNEIVASMARERLSIFSNYRTSRSMYLQELTPAKNTYLSSPVIGFAVGFLERTDEWKRAHKAPTASLANSTKPEPVVNKTSVKQYICAVSDDYTVTLYNHELAEQWSIRLPVPASKENFMYDELYDGEELYNWFLPTTATVMILPNQIYSDDKGLVIVAVEVELPLNSEEFDDDNFAASPRQLSYYALNGKDGSLRWSHNSTDEIEPSQEDKVKSQHSYKLTAQHLEHHSGEQDWRYYRRNLIASLPYAYTHHHDAKLQLHRFAPRSNRKKIKAHSVTELSKIAKDKSKDRSKSDTRYGVLGERVWSLLQWREKRKDMPAANVIVAHRRNGLEAIHLYTGKTLAQVGPLKAGWLYEDLNDDSIIDGVSTVIADTAQNLDTNKRDWAAQGTSCKGEIFTGIPYSHKLIHNHSICIEGGMLHQFEFLRSILKGDEEQEGTVMNSLGGYEIPGMGSRDHFDESITAATPISIHRHIHHGYSLHLARYQTDVLFYISSGLVTCLDGKTGKLRWHSDTDATFGGHSAGGIAKALGKLGTEETAWSAELRYVLVYTRGSRLVSQ